VPPASVVPVRLSQATCSAVARDASSSPQPTISSGTRMAVAAEISLRFFRAFTSRGLHDCCVIFKGVSVCWLRALGWVLHCSLRAHACPPGAKLASAVEDAGLVNFDAVAVTGTQIDTRAELDAYDVVVAGLVLHFVPDPPPAIREMVRAARPGGTGPVQPIEPVKDPFELGGRAVAQGRVQPLPVIDTFNELANGKFNTEQIWKMAKEKGLICSKTIFG